VIICESVLRRPPDVPGALQQQLFHLLEANLLPNLSVRVMPLACGPHRASSSGAFTILDFPSHDGKPGEPTTIYSEGLTGALYLDRPHEIDTYERVWAALAERALGERESSEAITAVMRELNVDA
jgi:hypothetical protein